jgi:hypothetical protein
MRNGLPDAEKRFIEDVKGLGPMTAKMADAFRKEFNPPLLMIRAFISHIDTGSETDFMGFAEDVNDALIQQGFDARQTLPWNPDAPAPLSPMSPAPQPSPLQPPPLPPVSPFSQQH